MRRRMDLDDAGEDELAVGRPSGAAANASGAAVTEGSGGSSLASRIEGSLVKRYLTSGDFNGLPFTSLVAALGQEADKVSAALEPMVAEGRVTVLSPAAEDNPAILRLRPAPPDTQLGWLKSHPDDVWLYPSPAVLTTRGQLTGFADRPYTARLAAGEPQLTLAFFDLQILDHYMRDPRFAVRIYDYGGSLELGDEYYLDESFPARDKIALQTFGIGYRPDDTRVVGIFLRYLSGLTPEHQWIWHAQEVSEHCRIAGDYMDNALGRWSGKAPLYEALLAEQVVINTMAVAMGRTPLFRVTYSREKPPEFHTLLRPTRRAYYEFVAVLDKMLSENLEVAFFGGDVSSIDTRGRAKGSLQMLADWIGAVYRAHNPSVKPSEIVTKALRRVRQERQEPAHKLTDDVYDIAYFKRQDDLLIEVYLAVQALRLILARHPKTAAVPVPTWLQRGDIARY